MFHDLDTPQRILIIIMALLCVSYWALYFFSKGHQLKFIQAASLIGLWWIIYSIIYQNKYDSNTWYYLYLSSTIIVILASLLLIRRKHK